MKHNYRRANAWICFSFERRVFFPHSSGRLDDYDRITSNQSDSSEGDVSLEVSVWSSTHDAVFPFNQTPNAKCPQTTGFFNGCAPLLKWNMTKTTKGSSGQMEYVVLSLWDFVGFNSACISGMKPKAMEPIALLSIDCTLSLCVIKGQETLFYPNNSYTSNNNNGNNNNKRLLIIVMRTILVSKDCCCFYLSCLQYPGFSLCSSLISTL